MHLLASVPDVHGVFADDAFGTGGSTGIAVLALISMIGGYALLAALWIFVFREKPAEKRARRAREEAAQRAAGQTSHAPASPREDTMSHGRPPEIERRAGGRFRRR